MELKPWIYALDEHDPISVAAEKLGEKPRTILSWARFERSPSIRAAINIVRVSGGVVDFNGIYGPVMQAVEAGNARL